MIDKSGGSSNHPRGDLADLVATPFIGLGLPALAWA